MEKNGDSVKKNIKLKLVGLNIEYNKKTSYRDIVNLWQKLNFLKKKYKIKIPYPWKKYGVVYLKDKKYYYFCGFEINRDINFKKVDFFENLDINISNFLSYKYTGSMKGLKSEYKLIFYNLKRNNIKYLNKPLLIEEYTEKFKWNYEGSIINIVIPVEKENQMKEFVKDNRIKNKRKRMVKWGI